MHPTPSQYTIHISVCVFMLSLRPFGFKGSICVVTCLVLCFSTWLPAKLTLKVEAMTAGDEAAAFKMLQNGQEVDAILTVTRSKGYKARKAWKAHVMVTGTRHHWSWRHSIIEAVSWQIHRHMTTISKDGIDRIQKVASQIQARRTDTVVSRVATCSFTITSAQP